MQYFGLVLFVWWGFLFGFFVWCVLPFFFSPLLRSAVVMLPMVICTYFLWCTSVIDENEGFDECCEFLKCDAVVKDQHPKPWNPEAAAAGSLWCYHLNSKLHNT